MSFQFNEPPLNTLSRDQENAVYKQLDEGDYVILSGCPGSGKTTVVSWRMKLNAEANVRYIYLVYGVLLKQYLKNQMASQNLDATRIHSVMKWYWNSCRTFMMDAQGGINPDFHENIEDIARRTNIDELLLDEGQDLPLDAVIGLASLTPKTFLCADPGQDVFGRTENLGQHYLRVLTDRLEAEGRDIYHIHLTRNYRNTKRIYQFTRACVPNLKEDETNKDSEIEFARSEGKLPEIYMSNSSEDMLEDVVNLVKQNMTLNIGILSTSKRNTRELSGYLDEEGISHSMYLSNNQRSPDHSFEINQVVVTTFLSCKGLEFDMVILPNADRVGVVREKDYKALYVAMSRAKDRLVLLCREGVLPEFMQPVPRNMYETID